MIRGTIIKATAGFYYVYAYDRRITYACKARGIFRKENIKPLVGDRVEIEITHEGDREGNVENILPRDNALVRPAAANVDRALVIFAMKDPKPSFALLDRFIVSMENPDPSDRENIMDIYAPSGYKVIFTSAKKKEGIKDLEKSLEGHVTVVAGPSGAGKSSLINIISPQAFIETGDVSRKIKRGRHTTRHVEMFPLGDEGTFIMDTPGFSSLFLKDMEREDLENSFPEIKRYADGCYYNDCSHTKEPSCMVIKALGEGMISPVRYGHYVDFYNELKDMRKY